MQYSYVKSGPLSDEEKRRLRVTVGAYLRLAGVIRHPSQRPLVNLLLALLTPQTRADPRVLDWLIAYGTPRLIARLREALVGGGSEQWAIRALLRIPTDQLLPREYITPDYQQFQTRSHPRTALVCFTGNALRLNVPVQLFHCIAANRFDLIIYLRDFKRCSFTQGIPGIARDQDELHALLRSRIPMDCRIAVIGTSGGGFAAVRFAERVGAERLAMFSPPLRLKDERAVEGEARVPPENVRIYFAGMNQGDRAFASDWSSTGYASSTRLFATDSHGTLRYLLGCEQGDALLNWLLGGNELPRILQRSPFG